MRIFARVLWKGSVKQQHRRRSHIARMGTWPYGARPPICLSWSPHCLVPTLLFLGNDPWSTVTSNYCFMMLLSAWPWPGNWLKEHKFKPKIGNSIKARSNKSHRYLSVTLNRKQWIPWQWLLFLDNPTNWAWYATPKLEIRVPTTPYLLNYVYAPLNSQTMTLVWRHLSLLYRPTDTLQLPTCPLYRFLSNISVNS